MARIIEVTDLILRDAQQSLLETSMSLEDLAPACKDLDSAGYWSLECWGGAAFGSCLRFLNEDPWERLRTYRKLLPKTRLQMLLRGQNLVARRNFDDSIVSHFVEKAALNGIDVFRVFDAFNDVRNLRASVEAVKKAGKHAQGAICYSPSPVLTNSIVMDLAQQLRGMGCDSICIHDADGFLKPQAAYDLVRGIKQNCGIDTLISVHTHSTTGVTMASLMKAVEAGCDMVDTAISSLALGRGHNPTESFVEMLEGTGYESRLDMSRLLRIKRHIAAVRPRYREFSDRSAGVETETFNSQIPAALVANVEHQMQGQSASHSLPETMVEVENVRRDAGYPGLLAPASDVLGAQAVFNVLHGRYNLITAEFADLMLGYYGTPLGPRNPEVMEMASARANKTAIYCRPADLLEPRWEQFRSEALAQAGCNGSDEDVLTYAIFPELASQFFKNRTAGAKSIGEESTEKQSIEVEAQSRPGSNAKPSSSKTYIVRINDEEHKVTVTPAR